MVGKRFAVKTGDMAVLPTVLTALGIHRAR
jgi:hypothetical protein